MKRKNVAYLMALLAITLALMFLGSVNLGKDTSISTSKSTIIIQKFSDTNFNGIVEPDEERLPGRMFIITGPNGMTTTYVTNDRGEIRIEVPEGKYIIVEQLRPGWTSTTPLTQVVNVQEGRTIVVEFLNAALGLPTKTPTPTPTPTPTQEIIIDEIEKLFPGQILFNVPENMTANEMERVEVRISKNFMENLTDGLRGRGVPHVEEIEVNSYMRVNLTGNYFNITPLSPEEQAVINDKFTQWGWDVTPRKSGILVLHFLVTLKLPDHPYIEWAYPVWDFRINVSSPKPLPEPSTPMPATPAPTSPPNHEPLWGHLYDVVIAAILAAIFAILFEIWKHLQKRGE